MSCQSSTVSGRNLFEVDVLCAIALYEITELWLLHLRLFSDGHDGHSPRCVLDGLDMLALVGAILGLVAGLVAQKALPVFLLNPGLAAL